MASYEEELQIIRNEYTDEDYDDIEETELDSIRPSYDMQQRVTSAVKSYMRPRIDVNAIYNRGRRKDDVIDILQPTFKPKTETQLDPNKPGKLELTLKGHPVGPSVALLTYMWKLTEDLDESGKIDLNFMKSLVDNGADINVRDIHGQTILHACVRDWDADVTLFAIKHNADVNAQDDYGRTPLHLAAALNAPLVAKTLCMYGAEPNIETFKDYHTPLHYAAKYNSINVLKTLLYYGGSISAKDFKGRTVPFIAAEAGSRETVRFLLEIEAPFGAFDDDGNSAITYLIEMLPQQAFHAMGQYVRNTSVSYCEMYISSLESDSGKIPVHDKKMSISPLEAITSNNDLFLIMHPVIQKSIEVKWKLFGRLDTVRKLFITFIYLVCWIVLAYTFSDNNEFYYDESGNWQIRSWTIAFELFIIVFALYFYFKDLILMKNLDAYHQRWVKWRKGLLQREFIYCHPTWPKERSALERELARIKLTPSLSGKQKLWYVYEWVILLLLSLVVITRVLVMIYRENKTILIIHKVIFCVNMIFSFIRILKIGIRFWYFSVFFKVACSCFGSIIQIGFLYVQVYIPFVAAFWIVFGVDMEDFYKSYSALHSPNAPINKTSSGMTGNSNDTVSATWIDIVKKLEYLFANVYETSFGQEKLYKTEHNESRTYFHVIMSLYHILSTFIALSIVIAFITARFRINFNNCVAEASLLQAYVVLQLEKNLNRKQRTRFSQYYAKYCNPLIVSAKRVIEEVREQDAIDKLRSLQKKLQSMLNNFTRIEKSQNKEAEKPIQFEHAFLQSLTRDIDTNNERLLTSTKEFVKELNNFTSSQETITKYLPKLIDTNGHPAHKEKEMEKSPK